MYLSLALLSCGHSPDDSARPVAADTSDTDAVADSAGDSSGDTSGDSSDDTSSDSVSDTSADTGTDDLAIFEGLTVLATFDGESSRVRPRAIAVGDLTGDGVPDVALSGDDDSFASASAGWVTVWPGPLADAALSSPSVIDIPGTVAGTWTSPDGMIGSFVDSDDFGSSLVVGDLNGDALDDLGVGGEAVATDGSGLAGGGAAYVFAGPLTTATTSVDPHRDLDRRQSGCGAPGLGSGRW